MYEDQAASVLRVMQEEPGFWEDVDVKKIQSLWGQAHAILSKKVFPVFFVRESSSIWGVEPKTYLFFF